MAIRRFEDLNAAAVGGYTTGEAGVDSDIEEKHSYDDN